MRIALEQGAGYDTRLALRRNEIERLRELIERCWHERLREGCPDEVEVFARLGIAGYHHGAHLLDHASFWPKRARLLPRCDIDEIRAMPFFGQLEEEFGAFDISDEDRNGWEEVYWRIVRPGHTGDVGPLHADRWFAECGDEYYPPGRERIKVWIAVVTEEGRNGLLVVPGSQLVEWAHGTELRHGSVKPRIYERVDESQIALVGSRPGEVVVFGENLIHGGALNNGTTTRISLEFTMLVCPAETCGHAIGN